MKLDYLKKKNEIISLTLFGVSALLGVLILVKVGGLFVASASARTLVEGAVSQGVLSDEEMEEYFVESKKIAEELKKKNSFMPPPPKEHPIKEVPGILGSEAWISGKWYKAGDKVKDAKIVAIEPTQVRVRWEGKEKSFAPIASAGVSKPGIDAPRRAKKRTGERREARREARRERVEEGRPHRGMMGRGFRNISDEDRARMRERWENMSEEERAEMRQRMGGRRRGRMRE